MRRLSVLTLVIATASPTLTLANVSDQIDGSNTATSALTAPLQPVELSELHGSERGGVKNPNPGFAPEPAEILQLGELGHDERRGIKNPKPA